MDAKSGVSWTPQPLTESEQFRLLSLIFGDRPAAVTS
ncbi:hypothetical protein M2317_000765 [Microbacterium sp. ZKA21]